MPNILPLPEVSQRGEQWFHRLEAMLARDHSARDFVAIEVTSGEYAVARSTREAMKTLYKRYPQGQLFLRRIGDEPEAALAARLFDVGETADK
jgi:hypothetical protein